MHKELDRVITNTRLAASGILVGALLYKRYGAKPIHVVAIINALFLALKSLHRLLLDLDVEQEVE